MDISSGRFVHDRASYLGSSLCFEELILNSHLLNKRKLPLSVLIFLQVLLLLPSVQMHGQEQKEEPKRTLSLSTLEGRINPHFEFTLPSGNIYQRIEQQFNNLNSVFSLNFNFLNSSIDANVAFSYPLGFFIPRIQFFQGLRTSSCLPCFWPPWRGI